LDPRFAGSIPAEGDTNPQYVFLQRGSKAVIPMSKEFTACKRSL
jgi:hypothetical protein